MLNKINPVVKQVNIPGLRYFSNQVSSMEDGINLTIGEPDFATPEKVKQAGIKAIEENRTGYSHNAGLLELRQEVTAFFRDTYGLSYHPENEVIITNGASEALDSVLRTIICEGDEVILPAPLYSAYESLILLNGGTVVYLDTTDTQFKPDPSRLEGLISNKTKAIILNYPSNPTGVTLNSSETRALVDVMKKHDNFIITDEIYSENTFHQSHSSFASYEEIKEKLFLVHGLSKSHSMTGWRIGFLLGPQYVMKQVLKVHLNNSICAPLPSQYAAMEALSNNRTAPSVMNRAYIERRDFILKRLQDMGLDVIIPNGAFYIFPSIKKLGINSFDFATNLLHKKRLAVVPGSSFSKYGEGFIRISYANSMDELTEGMDRLESYLTEFDKA